MNTDTTPRSYDTIIKDHYDKVASDQGLAATSTMADEIIRQKETDAIVATVALACARRDQSGSKAPLSIIDVGCGNGYTLEILARRFPGESFLGVEYTDTLRELAIARFKQNGLPVEIRGGDIREAAFLPEASADVLISQRVIINLLDEGDQRVAVNNLVTKLKRPGGLILFIESFVGQLERLNKARAEFDLPAIAPTLHNQYLPESFFDDMPLKAVNDASLPPSNFLSSHFYVARVLHPLLLGERPFIRNSEFVRFLSSAMPTGIGDYAPLKLRIFEAA